MKKLIFIGSLAGVASYFIVRAVRQQMLLEESCFNVVGFQIRQAGIRYAKIAMQLKIKNKSSLNLVISNQTYDVYIGSSYVAKISKPDSIKLPKHSDTTVWVDIEFDPAKVLTEGMTALLANQQLTTLSIRGKFAARTGIILMRIPVDFSATLKEVMTGKKDPC